MLGGNDDVTIRSTPSDRLNRAFTKLELQEFHGLTKVINSLPRHTRIFFQTAILSMVPQFSRAVSDGGWFRWKEWPDQSQLVKLKFEEIAELMIADAESLAWQKQSPSLGARLGDARKLPLPEQSVDALISSPPYANRHDYSRIFQIDLLLLGKSEAAVTRLRRHSIRSHVEAKRPPGYSRRLRAYVEPKTVTEVLDELPKDADPRIARLLKGYFEDLFLSLQELHRVLRPGGKIAYVIGNVRHAGTMVPVDEILVQLASGAGLVFDCAWVMRQRGNSAQQMGKFGREAARETVVLLTKVDNG